jgi:hypothetical protein
MLIRAAIDLGSVDTSRGGIAMRVKKHFLMVLPALLAMWAAVVATHAADVDMRPRTVIVFGNPKLGTPVMVKTPLLAIDVPPKALVWEDDQGKVWLSYNSADYLYKTIYPRHGLDAPPMTAPFAKALDEMSDYATK